MTLRTKLLTCLGFLGLVVALLAGTAFWAMNGSAAALNTILNDRVVPMRDLKVVADKYAVDIVDASHKARNGNVGFAQAAERVRAGGMTLRQHWKSYRATRISGDEERLAVETERRMKEADAGVSTLMSILERGDRSALDVFVTSRLYQDIDPVSDAIGELVGLQLRIAEETGSEAAATASLSRKLMAVMMGGALLVLAASVFIVVAKVAAPVRRLAVTIRGLAEQTGASVPHREQRDEVGDIARAVDAFRLAVIAVEHEKALAASQVTDALAEGLAALAKGDLTCELQAGFPPAYAKLRDDFNTTLVELRTTIGSVAQAAASIKTGAGEVSAASDDLSQRTEQQAASLEETSAAMSEITDTVGSTAKDASKANAAVAEARAAARRSGEVVDQTVAAMGRIEQTSSEISEIISTIDGIAFQTNLLALNAGVEAARAGDAGKGFAVVASEVRALAQRSADAAKDVKMRITASVQQVEAGVALVGETGSSLQQIIGSVEEISHLVQTIAAAAEQQATGLQQVNTAVSEMDGVTQQNAAMVEEATAAARSLATEADDLARQISHFDLGVAELCTPAVDNRAQRTSGRGRANPPSARKAIVRGNLALVPVDDDWSSF